jgi:hypothetical protein
MNAAAAAADPQAEFRQRAADRIVASFHSLDRDHNLEVTRDEAKGDLHFTPAFDDMDINRDGIVTAAELQRYIELRVGIRMEVAQKPK